jgi:integrase
MCQLWSGHSRAVPPFHWRVSGYTQGVDETRPKEPPGPRSPVSGAPDRRYLDRLDAVAPAPMSDVAEESAPGSGLVLVNDPEALARLIERTRKTIEDAVPPNTRRAYEGDQRRFAGWCASTGLAALPAAPGTIVVYMRTLADAGRRASTIARALAAICSAHRRAGYPSPWGNPLVVDMLSALRRELGTRPKKKKAADEEILRSMIAVLPSDLLGARDRALLLLGWCGAFRRSELVALDVANVTRAAKGRVVVVAKSKTDQVAKGEDVPVFYSNDPALCPVRALDAWMSAAGITEGAIFRQLGRRQVLGVRLAAAAVYDRVRHWAHVAGLAAKDYGAHSLRRGFMTTAARRGKDLDSIMRTSRHRSARVAREYIETATVHERGAGEGLL